MTETIRRAPARRTEAPSVTAAPWALVRQCLVDVPQPGPAARAYADLAERLQSAAAEQDRLRAGLEETLYRIVAVADAPQRAVLLPLRRSIHNGRQPTAALAGAARTLARELEVPGLLRWLELADELAAIGEELATWQAPALTERRTDLASLAAGESTARAAAAVSPELCDALARYADCAGHPDRRSVKSEANILRHLLRATTKTVPLSWFVGVGWSPHEGAHGEGQARSVTLPELSLVQRLLDQALMTLPAEERPLHVVPGSHLDPVTGRFVFPRRGTTAGTSQQLSLPATALLREIWTRVEAASARHGTPLTATALGQELPAVDPAALRGFIARLVELGALEHTSGLRPDDLDGAQEWLLRIGAREQAATLQAVVTGTAAYAERPASARRAALAELTQTWAGALGQAPGPVLTEDVILTGAQPAALARERLVALTPLAEVFDAFPLLRRVQRHRFVAAYGPGGVCPSLAEYARTYDAGWSDPTAFDDPAMRRDPVAGTLLQTRERIAQLADRWSDALGIIDTWLGQSALDAAAAGLPEPVRARPSSYAWFVQRDEQDGGLSVNQVYSGWGRFTSRFLDAFPGSAPSAVRESIRAGLGPQARAAQVRPLGGFAANVHPLVLDAEIHDSGRPARTGDLNLEAIEVVHDLATDDLRLRERGTSEWLDVIYQGFLVPMLLPPHWRAIVNDLGSGLCDFRSLAVSVPVATPLGILQASGRVQCGPTLLARRQWLMNAAQVESFQQLLADGPGRMLAVARLRAAAGWPRAVFLGSAPSALGRDLPVTAAFTTRMSSQRSQFVDLADPLHLHTLRKTLARYAGGMRVEEAWPVPSSGAPTTEFVVETYRRASGVQR